MSVSVFICWTKCWPCQFGKHNPKWHTWADEEDVDHALATGQPDPSGQRCGCHCCIGSEPTNPDPQPTTEDA